MTTIYKTADLAAGIRLQLDEFVEKEFGHIPIVKETEWATPSWTILYFSGSEIASFYNIVERNVRIDEQVYKTAGINNVITPPSYRGKGFSSLLLRETTAFIFNELKNDIGLLLCADNLIPFYEKMNWYKVDCPVYFTQKEESRLWMANTMLLTPGKRLVPSVIDLNGLPW
jgi:hypothetical protein